MIYFPASTDLNKMAKSITSTETSILCKTRCLYFPGSFLIKCFWNFSFLFSKTWSRKATRCDLANTKLQWRVISGPVRACVWAHKHVYVCVCNIANKATCNCLLFHCNSLSLRTELKCPRNQNTLICHANLSYSRGSADSSKATNQQNNLYLAPADGSSYLLFFIPICPARHQRGVLISPHSLVNLPRCSVFSALISPCLYLWYNI